MSKITDKVYALAKPIVEAEGCSLWDVEYVREAGTWYLRIFIDKENGVSINDCENISRKLDPLLDEADPIAEPYYLEISSPGIERELRTQIHIDACEGWDVEVKLYAPIDGLKVFRGVMLASGENGEVRIDANGKEMSFERSAVAKISTYFDF